MASITKKSEGKYLIRASKGTGANRQYINQVFRGTLKQARTRGRELDTMIDSGQLPQSDLKFKDYVDLWIKAVTPKLEPRTIDGYKGNIARYATPRIGHLDLKDIDTHHIQAVYLDIGTYLSPTTVRNLHASLNACFSWAIKHKYIAANPCKHTERPAKKRKEIVVLNDDEAARLVAACREMPNGLIFEFALETGMRPGEYLALRWSDISGNSVSVAQALQFKNDQGKGLFKDVKTATGRRRIPISDSLRQRLAEHRRKQLEHRMALRVTWAEHDLVFPNAIGMPHISTNLIRRYFRPILAAAKITSQPTLYSLRHTCATLLLMHDVNPKIVADRLGHSSVTLTLDTYSHVLPHIQDAATDIMSGILRAVK